MRRLNRSLPIFVLVLIMVLAAGTACNKAPEPKPLAPVGVAPQKETPADAAKEGVEEKKELFSYQVTDRNPFHSLLKIKKLGEEVPLEELTPLERVAVGDMRLESIILTNRKSVAHVITPDGKAHIITIGTPMGRHKGKVVRMNTDEVIVEEQFEDYTGRAFKQETVLRLREKEGENL